MNRFIRLLCGRDAQDLRLRFFAPMKELSYVFIARFTNSITRALWRFSPSN